MQRFQTILGVFGVTVLMPYLAIAADSITEAPAAFQTTYDIGVVTDIIVPTVVEMPLLPVVDIAPQFLLLEESETGTRAVTHLYQKTYTTEPVVIRAASGAGKPLPALNDREHDTTVDFPLTADEQTETVIELTSDEPVTSSQIHLQLASNVALPNKVKLEAETEAGRTIVVATRRLSSAQISFPETQSDRWFLTLTHGQPLRLSEVTLQQHQMESTAERSIRWLAQPDASYTLYTKPDRGVSIARAESGNLQDDRDVLDIAGVSGQPNVAYVAADVDADGVTDRRDNCVSIANADQTDINENGRGDACDDFDRDGVLNHIDNCRDEPNRAQRDEDGDGIGDSCDQEESRVTEKHAWIPWVGMGLVGLVILGLFGFMLRQNRQEHLTEQINEPEIMTDDTSIAETKMSGESADEKPNQ